MKKQAIYRGQSGYRLFYCCIVSQTHKPHPAYSAAFIGVAARRSHRVFSFFTENPNFPIASPTAMYCPCA